MSEQILIRSTKLVWYKSEYLYKGVPSTEQIVSGFLYNVFPPIVEESLLYDGGYLTRLVYLRNEEDNDVVHVRVWFVYPTDEVYGDPRRDPSAREVLLVGRQPNREVPPSNAPANQYSLPSGVQFFTIPLDNSDFSRYPRGIELGRIKPGEYVPLWLVLSIPPLVQAVNVTFVRMVTEGVKLS